jgi:hypothetical protein
LLHHLTIELLRDSFHALTREAAPGIDGMTWKEYETGLAILIYMDPKPHERNPAHRSRTLFTNSALDSARRTLIPPHVILNVVNFFIVFLSVVTV